MVSPVYGLPVTLIRDSTYNRYIIKGRDLGTYSNWGDSSYMHHHGETHSFYENGWGSDIVWVQGRQFAPLSISPATGTTSGNYVYVSPYVYYLDGNWHYAGGVSTSNLLLYKPTDDTAIPILIYLDSAGDVQFISGSGFSAAYITIDTMLPYIPSLPNASSVPLGLVRLISGTSTISWNELFDLRPLISWWT